MQAVHHGQHALGRGQACSVGHRVRRFDDLDVLARHPVAVPCHDQAAQLGRVAGPVVLDSAGHRRRCLAGADDDEPTATEILRARQVSRDAA